MSSSLPRFLLLRVLSGVVVVVGVVALTWLTLFVLRPSIIDDGTPVLRQLTGYLGRVFLHFDLGAARVTSAPTVQALLRQEVPADLSLLLGGIVVGTALGVAGGALAALRPRGVAARAGEVLAFLGFAAPVYVVGLGLLLLFGSEINALPTPIGIPLEYVAFKANPLRWFGALIVPWIVLGLPLAGLCYRVMAGMTVEGLQEEYVQTARAKGLGRRTVVLRHAARPALVPTLTLAGAFTNRMLLNLAILETVFGVPGVLARFPDVAGTSDVPLLLGITLVTAVGVVSLNLVVDLLLRTIDPAGR